MRVTVRSVVIYIRAVKFCMNLPRPNAAIARPRPVTLVNFSISTMTFALLSPVLGRRTVFYCPGQTGFVCPHKVTSPTAPGAYDTPLPVRYLHGPSRRSNLHFNNYKWLLDESEIDVCQKSPANSYTHFRRGVVERLKSTSLVPLAGWRVLRTRCVQAGRHVMK